MVLYQFCTSFQKFGSKYLLQLDICKTSWLPLTTKLQNFCNKLTIDLEGLWYLGRKKSITFSGWNSQTVQLWVFSWGWCVFLKFLKFFSFIHIKILVLIKMLLGSWLQLAFILQYLPLILLRHFDVVYFWSTENKLVTAIMVILKGAPQKQILINLLFCKLLKVTENILGKLPSSFRILKGNYRRNKPDYWLSQHW